VDAEGVERIVILEEGLELGAGQERDRAGSTPTQIAPVLSMKPQAGGHDNQAGDGAGAEAETRRALRVTSSRTGPDRGGTAVASVVVMKALGGNPVPRRPRNQR